MYQYNLFSAPVLKSLENLPFKRGIELKRFSAAIHPYRDDKKAIDSIVDFTVKNKIDYIGKLSKIKIYVYTNS
jgi:hypothetical protein